MFWLVIILIVAGTYYFVQWAKKKKEQQDREEEQREAQARPIQPPAPPPAAPLPPLPFDLSKGHVTAQLAGEIGRWTESNATIALGAPTKPRPPKPNGDHQDDYAYVDSAGQSHTVMLTFSGGRLTGVSAYPPQGISFEEVKQALGEPIRHPDFDAMEATIADPNAPKGHDYGNMWVWVDKTGAVNRFTISNASAAAHFYSGASWTTNVP
jgi:hypothetical protein